MQTRRHDFRQDAMSDSTHSPLNRREVERVAHEALGRQLRLMVALSALLLVLGFVVGQFTGVSLARRNTERLQAQLDQVERTLGNLESRLVEQRDDHSELQAAFIRIEGQRRSEIEIDRATLEAMIDNVQTVRTAANRDLDVFDAARRTVPTPAVRRMVDRFVTEQARSMEQLLTTTNRRLKLPDPAKVAAAVHSPTPDAMERPAAMPRATGPDESIADAPREFPTPPAEQPREDEPVIAEQTLDVTTPSACRPSQPIPAETHSARVATTAEEHYLAPPRRRGFLFFSPSQPRPMDETRVSDSESIPLPPR